MKDTQVWPISNTNLIMAAQTGDKDFLEVSYYSQLATALQTFLFQVAGWSRCTGALLVAAHYHSASRETLTSRLAGLEAESTQKLADLQQSATQRKQQFDAEWGTQGKKSRELRANVRNAATKSKQSFVELLGTGGKLETTFRQQIDGLTSLEQAKQLGATMDEQMITEIMNRWRAVCEEARVQCVALLGSLIETVDGVTLPLDEPDLEVNLELLAKAKGDMWDQFEQAQSEFLKAGAASANAVLIALYLFPAAVIPLLPIAVPAVVAAGIWAAIRKWQLLGRSQISEAQQELHKHLSDVLKQARERFLQADAAYGKKSLVNYYFNTLIETMDKQIQEIAEAKLEEAQAAITHLEEGIALNSQQRQVKAEQVRQQLADWDAIGSSIKNIMKDLSILDQSPIGKQA